MLCLHTLEKITNLPLDTSLGEHAELRRIRLSCTLTPFPSYWHLAVYLVALLFVAADAYNEQAQ
jgi:hypothetical protein